MSSTPGRPGSATGNLSARGKLGRNKQAEALLIQMRRQGLEPAPDALDRIHAASESHFDSKGNPSTTKRFACFATSPKAASGFRPNSVCGLREPGVCARRALADVRRHDPERPSAAVRIIFRVQRELDPHRRTSPVSIMQRTACALLASAGLVTSRGWSRNWSYRTPPPGSATSQRTVLRSAVAEPVVIAEVLIIQRQGHHPLSGKGLEVMLDMLGISVIDKTGRETPHDVEQANGIAQQQGATARGKQAAVEIPDNLVSSEGFSFRFR